MKHNICIIGLVNDYVKKVSKSIADDFEMMFADVMAMVQFDLIDVEKARLICGDDYILKTERNKVKNVCSYENTLFTLDYSLLNDDENILNIKNDAYIIYLKLSKFTLYQILKQENKQANEINMMTDVFEFRDRLCSKFADFVIDCNNKSVKEIINNVKNLFYNA